MKKIYTKIKDYQYFYPYTVAIVGAQAGDRLNYMACAWHTAVSFDPMLFGILLSKKRLTYHVISDAGEFSVNFIPMENIRLSAQMGRTSGHDLDKVKEFQVKLSPSKIIKSPILQAAYTSLECTLKEIHSFGDHELFVGQVVAAHEEEGSFNRDGVLNTNKIHPLLYMGSDYYMTVDPNSLKHQLPD